MICVLYFILFCWFFTLIRDVSTLDTNIALGKRLYQGSNFFEPSTNSSSNSVNITIEMKVSWSFDVPCPRTQENSLNNWFVLDLEKQYLISYIQITSENAVTLNQLVIGLTNTFSYPQFPPTREKYSICAFHDISNNANHNKVKINCVYQYTPMRYVVIQKQMGFSELMILCSIEVYEINKINDELLNCSHGTSSSNCSSICHCQDDVNQIDCSNCSNCAKGWSGPKCNIIDISDASNLLQLGCLPEIELKSVIQLSNRMILSDCITTCQEHSFIFAAYTSEADCFCLSQFNQARVKAQMACDQSNCSGCSAYNDTSYLPLYSVCPKNYFGKKCSYKCHCSDNKICSYPSGFCSNGCQKGWIENACFTKEDCSSLCDNVSEICVNTSNSLQCACKQSFARNNMTNKCERSNYCPNSNISCNFTSEECVSFNKTITCGCKHGYYRNNSTKQCILLLNSNCSFEGCDLGTEMCLEGINGTFDCFCKEGYLKNNYTNKCEKVNCFLYDNICDDETEICSNQTQVCVCKKGFRKDNHFEICLDVNECILESEYTCRIGTEVCLNTFGSYLCRCIVGFHWNNVTSSCQYIETDYLWYLPILIIFAVGFLIAFILILLCCLYYPGKLCCCHLSKPSKIHNQAKIFVKQKYNINRGKIMKLNHSHRSHTRVRNVKKEPNRNKLSNSIELEQIKKGQQRIYVDDKEMYIEKSNFIREFENLEKQMGTIKYAKEKKLRKYNRSQNHIPYDSNRIKLLISEDSLQNDYINASRLDIGGNIIVTQAPLENTLEDFWKMIIQEYVFTIVNLCTEKEIKRDPSLLYYPEYGSSTFDCCEIQFDSVVKYLDYYCRILKLKINHIEYQIYQWHFVSWPNHEFVNLNIASILSLRRLAWKRKRPDDSILLHDAYGAGRCGCLLAINHLLKPKEPEEHIAVKNCVDKLNSQRTNLIHSQAQYDFIYEAMAIDTELGPTIFNIVEYVDFINNISYSNDWRIINQYEYLMKEKFWPNEIVETDMDRKLTIPIKSVFTDCLFLISSNNTKEIWTEIGTNVGEIIVLNMKDCHFIPSNEHKLVLDNIKVFLEQVTTTPFGRNYKLKVQPHFHKDICYESSGYVMKHINIHQVLFEENIIPYDKFMSIFDIVFSKTYNNSFVCLISDNITLITYFVCASYILDALKKRQEVLVFPIVQELRRHLDIFSMSSLEYAELYNLVTEFLQKA